MEPELVEYLACTLALEYPEANIYVGVKDQPVNYEIHFRIQHKVFAYQFGAGYRLSRAHPRIQIGQSILNAALRAQYP